MSILCFHDLSQKCFDEFLLRKTQKKKKTGKKHEKEVFLPILATRLGWNHSETPFSDSQRPIILIETPYPTLYLFGVRNGDRLAQNIMAYIFPIARKCPYVAYIVVQCGQNYCEL